VAANDLTRGVDQDRHVEAEALNARGDLPDLFFGVYSRVSGIRLQLADRHVIDPEVCAGGRLWRARHFPIAHRLALPS